MIKSHTETFTLERRMKIRFPRMKNEKQKQTNNTTKQNKILEKLK